jgi:hypothetical protein
MSRGLVDVNQADETGKSARRLHERILKNKELKAFEFSGFLRGEMRGKTMDVPLVEVVDSLRKQYKDFDYAWSFYVTMGGGKSREGLKRALADIRNNAGCLFLKLVEEEQKKKE